jgi:hypothetical protein
MGHGGSWTRREALGSGLVAALALATPPRRHARAGAPERTVLDLTLTETAGLRRFGYPVHTHLPAILLPTVRPMGNYRLVRAGKPVSAQFRVVTGADGATGVALDFTPSLGPLESEHYLIEIGDGIEPGPEPRGPMAVEHVDGVFRVTHGSALRYVVRDGLPSVLESVSSGAGDYLLPGAGGLFVRRRGDAEGQAVKLGGAGLTWQGTITRQGPIAVGLRFAGIAPLGPDTKAATTLEMTFPSSKSWVQATWRVDDPDDQVAELAVDVALALEGAATLVDLGTAATIYGVLRGDERITLTAGAAPGLPAPGRTPWIIHKGTPDAMTTFAQAPRPDSPPAEGWAHVMDATRCTALAVADFGRGTRDRIEIDRRGRVRIARAYSRGGAPSPDRQNQRVLRFWLHFVPMPVQIGAATSPQAMLAPLLVMWQTDRS